MPLLTIYIFLATTAGGYTRIGGAILGSILLVVLLESTRFLAASILWLDSVQVASLREFAIAVALILVLQRWSEGMLASKNQLAGAQTADSPNVREKAA